MPRRHEFNVKIHKGIAIELISSIENTFIELNDVTHIVREVNIRYSVAMLDVIKGDVTAYNVLRYAPGREYLMDVLKRSGLVVYDPVNNRPRWRIVTNCE